MLYVTTLVLLAASSLPDGGTTALGEPQYLDAGTARRSETGSEVSPKAMERSDGRTPMKLADGSPNMAYFNPPSGYRSAEGFQKARWGMSPAEVQKLYPSLQQVQDGVWALSGTTADLDTQSFFFFARNRLAVVMVNVNDLHSSPDQYEADYRSLKDLLQRKYGKPSIDETTWKQELFRGDPKNFGTALLLGHVELKAKWNGPETVISITAQGKGSRVLVQLGYASVRLALQLQNEIADRATDDL
ncbi:hypothetical protein JGU66_18645 [Myxococcaceae bacterium JPH2]|nr:hypothetical protein [Myxococcaceae bacterium JPH2]